MSDDLLNAHARVGLVQWIFWNQIPLDTKLSFTLVDYTKAPVINRGDGHHNGRYSVYYAICEKAFDGVGVGDPVMLFLSDKTWVTALHMVPRKMLLECRLENGKGKSLLVTFEKRSKQFLKVHEERLVDGDEVSFFEAHKQYEFFKRGGG